MAELRTALDRIESIKNGTDDTFYFEHQTIDQVREFDSGIFENTILGINAQRNDLGRSAVLENESAINDAAAEFSINPDIVKAVIYAENSRGWYDSINFIGSSTVLPGNIQEHWEILIPGSDVNNVNDNIRLTAKLLSEIASRLENPHIEDIYALFNSMSHDRTYENAETKNTPFFVQQVFLAEAWNHDSWFLPNRQDILPSDGEWCFLAGTLIDMWPVDLFLEPGSDRVYDQEVIRARIWRKPIEKVSPDDWVVSFDEKGNLCPGKVTRTFRNEAKIVLNFFGTGVTPGHVYYRPDSKRAHKFETLIDVLRDDGMIEKQDGTLIRAATNVPVGDPRDGFVRAVTGPRHSDGTVEAKDEGRIRLGTRFIVDGQRSYAVADLIEAAGGIVDDDELIRVGDGASIPFHWECSDTLPKPEDFVLACSGTTLEDIYKAAEWEDQAPHMSAPVVLDGGPVRPLSPADLAAMPANAPLEIGVSYTVNDQLPYRKERRAAQSRRRRFERPRKCLN